MANNEDRHQGQFLGAHVYNEHLEKIEKVEKKFEEHFGNVGRNRAAAIRYIIDSFDPEWLKEFPKSRASVKEIA